MATDMAEPSGGAVDSKGLKPGALSLASATVVGVASTAPGYSIAASLGFVTLAVGFKAPAVMWLAFIPMACIASAFFYLNRADPDCGTNFTWVTRSMGPRSGWMGGWSSMIADLVIMPSLALIAAQYTFQLFGLQNLARNDLATLILGIAFIMSMTWICVVGIELSARVQMCLLLTELLVLLLFCAVALIRVYGHDIAGAVEPSWSWLTPTHFGGTSALTEGLLAAVFIYWGWDTAASCNEETEDASTTPGLASVLSTVILVAIFVVVAIAAQAVKGPNFLSNNSDDVLSATGRIVFGNGAWGWLALKLLIIAVLTSSAASCQTTILPAARTALSMAMHRALPPKLGEIHPEYLTPARASWIFGVLASVWFTLLVILSHASGGSVLSWSIDGVGLMIAYYYGQTGIACVIYYHRYIFMSVKNFIFVGLLPLVGGLTLAYIFVMSIKDFTDPAYEDPPTSWLGVSPVLFFGLGALLVGVPIMLWWNSKDSAFFHVKPDPVASRPPPEGGTPLPPLVEEGAPH
ncbi:MAG: amino acid transporter [Actinomycetia bacterium]|nr:amino acid transporter [Actinomycetes bacterium]